MTKQNQSQMAMGAATPHPLKGIINSNDDPMSCGRCSQLLDMGHDRGFFRMECCGKWICPDCDGKLGTNACFFCSWNPSGSRADYLSMLKRSAKKGHIWGQHQLGDTYLIGELTTQSYPDALRWLTKSMKRGHPESHMLLGVMLMEGKGCAVDLTKARYHLESALSLADGLTEHSQHHLTRLASRYIDEGSSSSLSEALSILRPLDEDKTNPEAQFHLGRIFLKEGDNLAAYSCFSSAAFLSRGDAEVAQASVCAFIEAKNIGQLPQLRLWSRYTSQVLERGLRDPHSTVARVDKSVNLAVIASLSESRDMLRSVRDICGGCGAEFEGKERKFCRGCRTYCYCSRDCQKMHWNRKHDGHREDCKAATELKQKMKEAKKVLGW